MKFDLKKISFFCLSATLFSSCGGNSSSIIWDDIPVVAQQTGDLIELDPTLLKDTIFIPLSSLIEDIHVVKLDNRDEALVKPSNTLISEKHILISNGYGAPDKLFDIDGNYLCDIGSIGNGPGEYMSFDSQQIDETNQRIYLLPWRTQEIVVYDFSGEFIESIPLPERIINGIFRIQGDQVMVATTPFTGVSNIAWIQSRSGEIIHQIPRDTSDNRRVNTIQIYSYQNTTEVDISYWYLPTRRDSLYYMNWDGNLTPRFTTKFEGDALKPHHYTEWPDYFLGSTSSIVHWSNAEGDRWKEGDEPDYYIVNKQSLKGGYLHLYNDLFDKTEEYPIFIFRNGYYCLNDEPANIEEMLEKALNSGRLPEKYRNKWTQLLNEIDPDDNNYILYAKIKR